jgi:hypothetical protein
MPVQLSSRFTVGPCRCEARLFLFEVSPSREGSALASIVPVATSRKMRRLFLDTGRYMQPPDLLNAARGSCAASGKYAEVLS